MLKSEASIAYRNMSLPAKSAYRLVHRHKEQLMVDMFFVCRSSLPVVKDKSVLIRTDFNS